MALHRLLKTVYTRPAAADLSARQFRLVNVDGNGRAALATGAASPIIGVLLNKPSAVDQACEIAGNGSIVKVEAGGVVAEGDAITADADGQGVATTTNNDEIVGYAISPAAAAGVRFECIITGPQQLSNA